MQDVLHNFYSSRSKPLSKEEETIGSDVGDLEENELDSDKDEEEDPIIVLSESKLHDMTDEIMSPSPETIPDILEDQINEKEVDIFQKDEGQPKTIETEVTIFMDSPRGDISHTEEIPCHISESKELEEETKQLRDESVQPPASVVTFQLDEPPVFAPHDFPHQRKHIRSQQQLLPNQEDKPVLLPQQVRSNERDEVHSASVYEIEPDRSMFSKSENQAADRSEFIADDIERQSLLKHIDLLRLKFKESVMNKTLCCKLELCFIYMDSCGH